MKTAQFKVEYYTTTLFQPEQPHIPEQCVLQTPVRITTAIEYWKETYYTAN